MDKSHILAEIQRTAKDNGGEPLGAARFFQETGIKQTDWYGKLWARWGDALREAGFEPNQFNRPYPDDELINAFISLIRELHRFPVRGELKMKARGDKSFPSHNAFARLGSKRQLAAKILSYCEKHSGHEDVAALCEPVVREEVSTSDSTPQETAMGFVYLMKSGQYYQAWAQQCGGASGIRAFNSNAREAHHRAHHPHGRSCGDRGLLASGLKKSGKTVSGSIWPPPM